jgi:hypothetical protein
MLESGKCFKLLFLFVQLHNLNLVRVVFKETSKRKPRWPGGPHAPRERVNQPFGLVCVDIFALLWNVSGVNAVLVIASERLTAHRDGVTRLRFVLSMRAVVCSSKQLSLCVSRSAWFVFGWCALTKQEKYSSWRDNRTGIHPFLRRKTTVRACSAFAE